MLMLFKDTEKRAGWARLIGSGRSAAQVDKIIKFGENSSALLVDTHNHTDRKMWLMIQSRVNWEAIVIKRVTPSRK